MTISRRDLIIGGAAAMAGAALVARPSNTASADPFCLLPAPRWSDPATWGGTVPAPGANVTIPASTVVLDIDATVGELSIPPGATLLFDPTTSRTLQASGNVVVHGRLTMNPADATVVHTLRFAGFTESAMVGGGMTPIATDVGLWVMGAGVLDAQGAAKTSWVRAAGSVAAGATTVQLAAAPTGWLSGDALVIVPTQKGHDFQRDERDLVSVTDDTITLSSATQYAHPQVDLEPGFTVAAEVLNLTRNVRIEGTAAARAHVFIMSTAVQTISFAEFRWLGARKPTTNEPWITAGIPGRYPLHLHMMGDATRGTVLSGLVARQTGNHAFVTHESHGVTYDACIAHDVFDDAFWWDPWPAVTNDTTYQSCVVSYLRVDPTYRGFRLAAFNLGAGTGNRALDCVAVGNVGNTSASGFSWPEMVQSLGDVSTWDFRRCIAHNNRAAGIFTWQNNAGDHVIEDFVCYHNGINGVEHGAYVNNYRYRNGWLIGNGTGVTVHSMGASRPTTFESLLIDGRGTSAHSVKGLRHHIAGQANQFLGCELVGHTGATYHFNQAQAGHPDVCEFVESGAATATFGPNAPAASVVRVQHAGTATEYAPAGSSPVAPFSDYTPVARVPFSVLASA